MSQLTDGQLNDISIVTRSCSAVSLLGCVFIIVTFSCSSAFRGKPINRLVFYASFGNMMTNVATLISRAYLGHIGSFGCQFQAMLIQWFMAADAGWILAMAINVYLTFYQKFDAKRLRRMELTYLLACYGIPFIPAYIYLFISQNGQHVYGDATLWCWVSNEFDYLRVATFYGPVWVIILITVSIYIRAGRTIFENHKQLREFKSDHDVTSVNGEEVTAIKRTEVTVTTGTAGGSTHPGPIAGHDPFRGDYSVRVSADHNTSPSTDVMLPVPLAPLQSQISTRRSSTRRGSYEFKSAAWSYTKCSLLYFTAILITWIPSSANRVYSLVHGGNPFAPLEFMSAFVLPLQGFWNWLIYTVMSWDACKNLFRDIKARRLAVSEMTVSMSGANITASRHGRHRSLP